MKEGLSFFMFAIWASLFVVFFTVLTPDSVVVVAGPNKTECCNTEASATHQRQPHVFAAAAWAGFGSR
jgi:hypothetical protein